jgi:hypothetical protein
VSFTERELSEAIAPVSPATLSVFETQSGTLQLSSYGPSSSPLLLHPIVRIGDRIVVAQPASLLFALRNEIIRLALERNVATQVAQRYCSAGWHAMTRALSYLRHRPLPFELPTLTLSTPAFDGVFSMDTDKILYVLLFSDALHAYDPTKPETIWESQELRPEIDARFDEVESILRLGSRAPNEALLLLLIHGVGRGMVLGFNRPKSPGHSLFLMFGANDFETLALLEGGTDLTLRQYAQAHARARDRFEVLSPGALDEFALYRKHRSYYFSDGAPPNFISVAPGIGAELKRDVARRRDFHAAPYWQSNMVKEVTTLHDSRDIPVYIPLRDLGSRVEILVEGLPCPIWIIGPDATEVAGSLYRQYAEFADAIAYWLWQVTPSIAAWLTPLKGTTGPIAIRLVLVSPDMWTEMPAAANTDGSVVVFGSAMRDLVCEIRPSFVHLLQASDNRGERHLIRALLTGLRSLLPADSQAQFTDRAIAAAIDKHARVQTKRMLLLFDLAVSPELNPHSLPPVRLVQRAEEEQILDEVGASIQKTLALSTGRVPDERRLELLHAIVAHCFNEIERLVSTLRPQGLVEWLIARDEALTRDSAFRNLTIPTRLACFSSVPDMVTELSRQIPERAKSATASRFIIEYVAAQPPRGLRPMSLSVYDRLHALSAAVVSFGFEAEMLYWRLAEFPLHMLASGRIGISGKDLDSRRSQYLQAYASGELMRAADRFGRAWRTRTVPAEIPATFEKIDLAYQAETGYRLTHVIELLTHAIGVGLQRQSSFVRMTLADAYEHLARLTQWELHVIEQLVESLCLCPRPEFLSPPAPYTKADVYPWIFNRPLSYIRRPFVLRSSAAGQELLWGNRHMEVAGRRLFSVCVGGQFVAKSPEMRRVMGDLLNRRGAIFNSAVAGVFESDPGLIVRKTVKRLGELKGAKGPPGDIDVLVIDRGNRRVLVIECKDISLGRTPREVRHELEQLFIGTRGRASTVAKHKNRRAWVRNNLDYILKHFGLPVTRKWRAEALIVVDEEIVSPYLYRSPIRVKSFAQIQKEHRRSPRA